MRRWVPVLLALLALVVAAAIAVAVAAAVAEPGDRAWSLTRALWPDYTRVVDGDDREEVALRAATKAATEARDAIGDRDFARAQRALARLRAQLPVIDDGGEQTAGWRLHALLTADLRAQTTTTTGVQ